MKELSIEEKAERYEEAIKRAKGAHNSAKSDKENGVTDKITEYTIQLTETIFPELKESEDEKVIRDIKVVLECSATKFFKEEGKMPIWYDRAISWLEKQGEQNHDDKVEPKFKVGDWVAINPELRFASPLCIKNIDDNNYRVKSLDGNSGAPIIDYLDNHYHLWTIQDAKDGDVLVADWYQGDDYWETIIIFKKYHNKGVEGMINAPCVEGYGNTFKNRKMAFVEEVPYYSKTWTNNLHPATKEQRDLLFTKIKDAGYASTVKIDALIDELKLL